MKTDYPRYYLNLTLIALISWTISCSGNSGKAVDNETEKVAAVPEEPAQKLIKMTSPGENMGFKLNDQIKVALAPADR
ncbi:MAG: hypothetical protein C0408_04505, partial [Odoribacter sp.]|nr:hypothetical protein [Odoribacter sp.]